jgi:hypothetical protein
MCSTRTSWVIGVAEDYELTGSFLKGLHTGVDSTVERVTNSGV